MKAAALLFLAIMSFAISASAEIFWNKDKSRSFEGTFLEKDGEKFVFERKSDQKTFKLSADQLAPESLELIEKLMADPAPDTPPPADLPEPKGEVFVYREGGLFLSALPKQLNLEEMWASLANCTFLKENKSFLQFEGDAAFAPLDNAKAYDFQWLNRHWVLVAQVPNIVNSMASAQFYYFLPDSTDYDEDQTIELQKELDAALTKISGIGTVRYNLWSLHPEVAGNEPGGTFPQYFKEEEAGKAISVSYYRFSYQPRRMLCIYTSPYGRVLLK